MYYLMKSYFLVIDNMLGECVCGGDLRAQLNHRQAQRVCTGTQPRGFSL